MTRALAILLFTSALVAGAAEPERLAMTPVPPGGCVVTPGVHYDYFVVAPATPPAAGKLRPAIVYLHGKGLFQAEGLDEVRRDWVVRLYQEQFRDLDAYLVVPHARDRWEGPALVDVLDRLVHDYPVDPAAITLFGYSTGASGAWCVARHAPERIAAIATLAGNPPPPSEAERLAPVAVWAWYGDKDYAKPLADTSELLTRLAGLNADTRFTLLPGVTHGQLPGAVFPRRELYVWLAARRLPAARGAAAAPVAPAALPAR